MIQLTVNNQVMRKIKISDGMSSLWRAPINWDAADGDLITSNFMYNSPTINLSIINNPTILYNGKIFHNNKVIPENYSNHEEYVYHNSRYRNRIEEYFLHVIPARRYSETFYWVIDRWSYNHFHFLCVTGQKLQALSEYNSNVCIILPLKIRKYIPILKSFKHATGINFKFLAFWDLFACVDELYLASPAADSGYFNERLMRNFAQNVMRGMNIQFKTKPNRKVYISRRNARTRQLENESELLAVLESYGFEFWTIEDLAYIDQIKLMSETSVLFSVHGAGLTNMMFMPQNGIVIEARTRDYNINCYFGLSNVFEHDYYYIWGSKSEDKIVLDPNKLSSVLDQLEI